MRGVLVAVLLVGLAGPVWAQGCPPSYRFVDFGVEGRDGILRRGGVIFRAFDAAGQRLLLGARSLCRDVAEVAVDGRGLPIPVVARVEVDTQVAGLALELLRLSAERDPVAAVEAHAARHRDALDQGAGEVTRGADFLCLEAVAGRDLSCQLLPVDGAGAAPVIYCDPLRCDMPGMVYGGALQVGAVWARGAGPPDAVARDGLARMRRIQAFLDAQI